jgi:hypothetical protein
VVPDRQHVRGKQWIGGDTSEETDAPEDIHQLGHSADDYPALILIPLFHGQKRDLGVQLAFCAPVDNCVCHAEHV